QSGTPLDGSHWRICCSIIHRDQAVSHTPLSCFWCDSLWAVYRYWHGGEPLFAGIRRPSGLSISERLHGLMWAARIESLTWGLRHPFGYSLSSISSDPRISKMAGVTFPR